MTLAAPTRPIVTNKIISIRDVFEAIKVDGYDHLRDAWMTFKKSGDSIRPIGACVIGGAAINLGVIANTEFTGEVGSRKLTDALFPAWSSEEEDDEDIVLFDLEQALDQYTQNNSDYLDSLGWGLGRSLVHYNDKRNPENSREYLYSYPQLVKIAEDILSPYFDQMIQVTAIDYMDSSLWNA